MTTNADYSKRWRQSQRGRAYHAWYNAIDRCHNPKALHYDTYGARGITVDDSWQGEDGFLRFLEDMGEPPKGTTLDRTDNDRGYSPGNCRWATWLEQGNNRRDNRFVTAKGETHTLSQWARILGIKYDTLKTWNRRGQLLERLETLKI